MRAEEEETLSVPFRDVYAATPSVNKFLLAFLFFMLLVPGPNWERGMATKICSQ